MHVESIGPNLWRFADTCNVYVLRDGDGALAIDFGSGRWRAHLAAIGSPRLEQVLLTHHHADTCAGLAIGEPRDFVVHAPVGEACFLDPLRQQQGTFDHRRRGCPDSYAVVRGGVTEVRYDLAGFSDLFWRRHRIRLVHTPGHGPHACSVVLDAGGRQVVCCGDAAHARATGPVPSCTRRSPARWRNPPWPVPGCRQSRSQPTNSGRLPKVAGPGASSSSGPRTGPDRRGGTLYS